MSKPGIAASINPVLGALKEFKGQPNSLTETVIPDSVRESVSKSTMRMVEKEVMQTSGLHTQMHRVVQLDTTHICTHYIHIHT